MTLEIFAIWFAWTSIGIFIGLAIYKYYSIASLPLNLRWEIYPVPQESNERRKYGGSYMEEVDWSERSVESSKLAELAEMGAEIFTLKRVRDHNPYQVWPLSITMHWGIYLLLIWFGLLAVSIWFPIPNSLTIATGVLALTMGLVGSIGLIIRRISSQDLKLYSTPADYFNLIFLALVFGLGLISWVFDPQFKSHQTYLENMLTMQPSTLPIITVAMFFTLQTFAIYMPFTKLIHYVMKHFTFTEILWDDAYTAKDSDKERQIQHQLGYPKRWSGSHYSRKKTWIEDVQSTTAGDAEK